MYGHNSIPCDEHDNTQNNYTDFPPGYIPPNNPPSQDSYSNPQSQQPSQPQLLEFPQQQQPLEEGQVISGQRNSRTRQMLHQPQAFVQQQFPCQYLMTQPPSRLQSYSSLPIQSSPLQSIPQWQLLPLSQDPISLDDMNSFNAQSQSSLQSHPQMPTDFSSGSMQIFEMSALSQVEKSEQDIVTNAFRAQASPQNDASGQETRQLSELHLGSTETIENGTNRNMVSAFRDRLLSRNYFLIRWDKDLEHIVAGLIHAALNDVHVAIGQLCPALSKSDIGHAYSMLIVMQNQDPSMTERPFEYLLENRLTRLLQYLGCDLHRVCSVCEDLMSIYNKRMSKIVDRFEIQPLVNRICSAGKKVVFMSRARGKNSDRVHKSSFHFSVETKKQNQVHPPLKIPIYIHNISQPFDMMNHGDSLEIAGHASKDPDDQLLQVVMEDLSCNANDMVFMRYNAYQNASMTLDGILVVDISTGVMRLPTLYSTDGTRYRVNSHTNLTRILAGELVENAS